MAESLLCVESPHFLHEECRHTSQGLFSFDSGDLQGGWGKIADLQIHGQVKQIVRKICPTGQKRSPYLFLSFRYHQPLFFTSA